MKIQEGIAQRSSLIRGWEFLRYLVRQFVANQGALNAAALTYTTLFAVVPLMTVTYSMLASIPSFQGVGQQLEALIFDHFVPSSGASLREYLSGFAAQARTLTAVGVGFLVVTAVMMLKTIESAFNRIWRVRKARKGLSSFLIYWAVLSLGPLLLGLGFALTSYVASLPLVSGATEALGGRERLFSLLPLLTSAAAFTLIYVAVPSCPVRGRHALVGGVVVALAFEAAKRGFALFITHFPSYQLIYGAFAAVPMFLAWIYISWLIILLGAELVRAQSTFQGQGYRQETRHLYWVLTLLQALWTAQREGRTLDEAALQAALPELQSVDFVRYLNELQAVRVVVRSEQGGLLLCQDLHCLTVEALWQRLPWALPRTLGGGGQPWQQELERRLRTLDAQRSRELALDLGALFSIRACGVPESDSLSRRSENE